MLKHTLLSRRLILLALLSGLAIVLVVSSVFYVTRQYGNLLNDLTGKDLVTQEEISKCHVAFSEINSELFKLLNATIDSDNRGDIYLAGRKVIDRIDRLQRNVNLQNFGIRAQDSALIDNLQKDLGEYKNTAIIGLEMSLASRNLQILYTNRVAVSFNQINHAFLNLIESGRLDMTNDINKASETIRNRLLLLGSIAALLVAGLAGFMFRLISRMSRQFNYVENNLKQLRQGDATEMAAPPIDDPAFASLYEALASFRATLQKLSKSELNLSEKNQALEQHARELALARDAAQHASEAKSQFLANMSHELRTPLNGIMGMTQLLLEMQMDQDQRSMLQTVDQSSRNLHGLIEDLLDFSKIEQGRLKLITTTFHLREVIEDAVSVHAGAAAAKGLALVYDLAPGLPERVISDPMRLRQLLDKLIDNAIKFTESGNITVSVRAEPTTAGVAHVHFSVSDTGIGIPADLQTHIFDAFAQADGSSTRRYGGAGMGLTICQQLTRLMGGNISLESQPGKGSRFDFELPFTVVAVEKTAAGPSPSPISIVDNKASRRVLIVEDNLTNQTLAKAMLKKLGFDSGIAMNGQEALEKLDAGHYDLVLMDCQMPVMDGYEATRAIRHREIGGDHHIPILAVTAHAMAGDRERCLEAGMDDYLSKPFQFNEFQLKINRLLSYQAMTTQS